MAPDTSTPSPVDTSAESRSSSLVNALIGGIVGVVFSFIPLSTLLGGAAAGYLEGGRPRDGLRVGTIAGLIMLIPFVFVAFFLLFVLGFGGVPVALGVVGLFILFFVALYTVGLSALGGYLGSYLRNEV